MKFGGTSVASPEKIKAVAEKVVREHSAWNQVVVVVSAMGKTTDNLIDMAHQINADPPAREMDMLMSTGEQVSIALMAIAIESLGRGAVSFTGPQVGIYTDNMYRKARIRKINDERIRHALAEGKVVVVAGFQGVTEGNDITTLGRGGSDTTAVALAAALKADRCDIYTDVDGVYTADPRLVRNARKLDRITYDEMLELASVGAQVLYHRAVEIASNYNVPLHVRSSFKDVPGTMVVKEVEPMEDIVVSGVAYNRDRAKISLLGVPDRPGIAAELFGRLAEHHIAIGMIIQNVGTHGLNDISFTVDRGEAQRAMETAREACKAFEAKDVILDANVAKVSLVGAGIKSHTEVAARMFGALARNNINIESITTSEIRISCLIREDDVDRAVQAIHDEFALGEVA
ncbi:aspartate kinase [candidate division BRC1 bacterium SM23_51]|nr:MAG: aspartate kinase [candidate division BRC1 bacterium SM23_51]